MEPTLSKIPTSIALAPELRDRLDRVAAETERSRSFVATKAIERYLDAALPGDAGEAGR